MTTPPPPRQSSQQPASDPRETQARAAELMAAVKAVESGERAATEFFTAPAPTRPTRPAGTGTDPGPGAPAGASHGAPEGASGPDPQVPAGVDALLARGGAPSPLGVAVVRALGPDAEAELEADPWRLLLVPGVQPEQVDGFARALLGQECDPGDPRRGRALALWLLERAARAGHTVVEEGALTRQLSSYGVPEVQELLEAAVADGAMLAFQEHGARPPKGTGDDADETAVTVLLGLERWAAAEEGLAEGVQRLLSTFEVHPETAEGAPAAQEWSRAAAEVGSSSASELVRASFENAVVTHTGGEAAKAEPVGLAAAARRLGLRTCLVAHSAYGASHLISLLKDAGDTERHGADQHDTGDESGPYVVTLAGLLGDSEGPARDEEGCFAVDVMVVTDATLLDAETAAALVESLPEGARLVLSGDPRLLGPAGAGQVWADLLAARVCPQLVSRTPDTGVLGELLSSVGVGELPGVQAPDRELVIVPVREAGEAVHRTVQLVADSVPRAVGVASEHTQVITVAHGGGAGTRELNVALKQRLNPGPGAFAGFDPGDRVAYSPAPGRTVLGQVVGADQTGLRLRCGDRPVTVGKERVAGTVRHGWAITAHQAAGQRWQAAVVVLPGDAAQRLDRPWVYTALGRGIDHVSVVHGVGEELSRAVVERAGTPRTTRLRTLLTPVQPATAGAGAEHSGGAE